MRCKFKVPKCLAGIVGACLLAATPSLADETYQLNHIISLPHGQILGAFDISFVSVANGIYALAVSRTSAAGLGSASGPVALIVDTANDVVANELTSSSLSGACSIPPARDDYSGLNGMLVVQNGGDPAVWAGNGPIYSPTCAFPGGNPALGSSPPTGTLVSPSSAVVWDLNTGAVKATISTGGKARADELCYNPTSDVVLIANDDPSDSFITFIGQSSLTVQDKIRFDGTDPNGMNINANGIEQCAFNPRDGNFYINIPMTGGANGTGQGFTLRISAAAPHYVEAAFPIAISTGCVGPQGLSVGPDHQLALGCGGTNSLIIDDRTGSTVATVAGAGGTDEDWYNPGSNEYFFAASSTIAPGAKTAGALFVEDAGGNSVAPTQDTALATASGSHSVAANPVGNRVYVPIRGNAVGGTAAVCSKGLDASGVAGNDSAGCIAVFTATNDSDDCVPSGAPIVKFDPDGNPNFLKASCRN